MIGYCRIVDARGLRRLNNRLLPLRGLPATYAVALPRQVDFQEPRHHFDAMQMQDHRFWRLTHAGKLLTGF